MVLTNERMPYTVTLPLIGWSHTQNGPWYNTAHQYAHGVISMGDVVNSQYSSELREWNWGGAGDETLQDMSKIDL